MFNLETVHDVIRIPPYRLAVPTTQAIQREIDAKYPNRILMDTGLVISRHGECLSVDHGVCIPGDGGAHHQCCFQLVVFRPFVEEVILARIFKSTSEGLQVSLGFFSDIFIPAYWMLNPSRFDTSTGLWIWSPQYDDDEDNNNGEGAKTDAPSDAENQYQMYVGAEIRFKVKSINFTQITNTAKGVQATMTSTSHMPHQGRTISEGSSDLGRPVRKRSSSVGIDESQELPASMHIVASICEDGLGLTEWWRTDTENA